MFVPAALAPALLPISLSGKSSSPLANANYRKLMRMHSVVIVHEAHLRQIALEGIVLMRSASQVERNGVFLGSANDAVSREQFGQGCTNLTFWTFFPFFCNVSLIAKNRKDTSSPFFFSFSSSGHRDAHTALENCKFVYPLFPFFFFFFSGN